MEPLVSVAVGRRPSRWWSSGPTDLWYIKPHEAQLKITVVVVAKTTGARVNFSHFLIGSDNLRLCITLISAPHEDTCTSACTDVMSSH